MEVFGGPPTTIQSFLGPKSVLFVRLAYQIDARLMTWAPRLRFVCSPTTGHTHLDERALAARGVDVISLRGERAFLEGIHATPEHTLGLLLALLRRYRLAFRDVEQGIWERSRHVGDEVSRHTVGIIGLGRVGRRVAGYLLAMGARVHFVDPDRRAHLPSCTRYSTIASLIRSSDIVLMCASHGPGVGPILDADSIALLKGKYFVNTARGELVDEPALLDLVTRNGLAGVAVDVIANETGPNRLSEWIGAAVGRNVIITPHIGGATRASMWASEEFIAERLRQRLRNAVAPSNTPIGELG